MVELKNIEHLIEEQTLALKLKGYWEIFPSIFIFCKNIHLN